MTMMVDRIEFDDNVDDDMMMRTVTTIMMMTMLERKIHIKKAKKKILRSVLWRCIC